MALIELDNVTRTYHTRAVDVHAVADINLRIDAGSFVAFSGPSGSGKTTLFNLIACLDRPTEGRVFFQQQEISALSPSQAAAFRSRHVGFVFQGFNLLPVLTAFENVELPLLITPTTRRERRARVVAALDALGIAHLATHKPGELSGGQKQRVAIARALVTRPRVIVADEPTANLDSASGERVLDIAKNLNREHRVTFLFSSHDPAIVAMADRVVTLKDGHVVDSGVARPEPALRAVASA